MILLLKIVNKIVSLHLGRRQLAHRQRLDLAGDSGGGPRAKECNEKRSSLGLKNRGAGRRGVVVVCGGCRRDCFLLLLGVRLPRLYHVGLAKLVVTKVRVQSL